MPEVPSVRSWTKKNTTMRTFVFVCFVIIALVAVYDTWAAAVNSEILKEEKNPICVKLLELDPDGRTWFVAAKSMGAAMTLSVLSLLLKVGYRHAMFVTGSIAAFQMGLMVYLCFSDPRWYGLPNFFVLYESTESVFFLS